METFDNQGNYKNVDNVTHYCEKHKREYSTMCIPCGVEHFDMLNRAMTNKEAKQDEMFGNAYGDWPEEALELEANYDWDDTHHFINTLNVKG